MSEKSVDFAVVGTGPIAWLLAAQLKAVANASVAIVGAVPDPMRLSRGLDLALPLSTHPALWSVLAECVSQTSALLDSIGAADSKSRHTATIFAATAEGRVALGLMAHMATHFGKSVERYAGPPVAPGMDAFAFSGVDHLSRRRLGQAFERWATANDVPIVEPTSPTKTLKTGETQIEHTGGRMVAATIIVTDASMAAAFPPTKNAPRLVLRQKSALLLEPVVNLHQPLIGDIDSGLWALAGADRAAQVQCEGPPERAETEILRYLRPGERPTLVASATYRDFCSPDGGPVLIPQSEAGSAIIAGFGAVTAFLVPALARFLCNRSTKLEKEALSGLNIGRTRAEEAADYRGSPTVGVPQ